MRPGEFWEALAARQEEVNADRRHLGELIRGATLRLFNLQVDKQYRLRDPAKFWPMPWDDPMQEADEIKRLEDLSEAEKQLEVEKFLARTKNHGKQRTESQG